MALPDFMLGAAGVWLARLLGSAAQFVFYLVVAQRFGADGLGLFVLASTTSLVGSTIGRWGIDQAALRYLSGYHAHGELSAFRMLFVRSAGLVLIISALIALTTGLLSALIAIQVFNKPELASVLRVLSFSIVPFSLLQLTGEALRATGRPSISAFFQGALVPLLALVVLVFAPDLSTVNGAALSYTLACIVAMAAAFFFQLRSPSLSFASADKSQPLSIRELLATATPIAWVTIFSVWLGFSETFLLGLYRTTDEVGYYAAPLRLVMLLNFLPVAFNAVLAPKFAVLHRQERGQELVSLARRATLVMLALSCPVFLALFLFPEALLALFGGEFTTGSTTLVILAVGQLVNVATGPVGAILLMTGNERTMRRHMIVTVLVNVALALTLIPPFGIVGAACSAATGMVVLNLLSLHTVYKVFGSLLRWPLARKAS